MTSANDQWQQLRHEYLGKAEKSLQGAPASERNQILTDVSFHLDKRFAELGPQERTWENMQRIITEMGPPEDYAELLEEKSAAEKRRKPAAVYWIASLIFVLLIAGSALTYWKSYVKPQETISPVAGYLLHFAPVGDFAPATPRELLNEFNQNHPQNVSTWYFRTEPQDGRLQGSIFTSTQKEANLLEKMIDENPKLRLLRNEQVTMAELEVHKQRKQLSLPRQ